MPPCLSHHNQCPRFRSDRHAPSLIFGIGLRWIFRDPSFPLFSLTLHPFWLSSFCQKLPFQLSTNQAFSSEEFLCPLQMLVAVPPSFQFLCQV
jgi:hypothetical protein